MKPSQILKNLLSQVFGQSDTVKESEPVNIKNCSNCSSVKTEDFCIHCDSHRGMHIQSLIQELKNPKTSFKKKQQTVEQYIEKLTRLMHEAISIEDYEKAGILKDCISVTKTLHLEETGLKLALAKAIQENNEEEAERLRSELQNVVEKCLSKR